MSEKKRDNVLIVMCDQFRYDCIHAAGNSDIYTPNLDSLIADGALMENAYSSCPVCVPARYSLRLGRSPLETRYFQNEEPHLRPGDSEDTKERAGSYIAEYMRNQGYRTFGIGKFHTVPMEEDLKYDIYQRCEEFDGYPDSYTQYVTSQPAYKHIEQLHGERSDMYYEPQMSPLPKELTSEAWVTDRAIEQILKLDDRPFYGIMSFVGPHPPFAPPVPFNRMYDPDRMPAPKKASEEIDFMDERVAWNNYFVFAEDISDGQWKKLRTKYYGEISYIDWNIGRLIKTLKEHDLYDNTMIIFTADHGEYLGDHHTCQKENFFEQSCHVPMIVHYPAKVKPQKYEKTCSIVDIFGLVSSVSGNPDLRDGRDLYSALTEGKELQDEPFFAFSSEPGSLHFRMMNLQYPWKYIWHANGGGELLFNLEENRDEDRNYMAEESERAARMRRECVEHLKAHDDYAGLNDEGTDFREFPRTKLDLGRVYQFNKFRGVMGFPDKPENVVYHEKI